MTRCEETRVLNGLDGVQKERAVRANEIYCRACEDNGLKVCSWETFAGWQEFVDGNITESQLSEKASEELTQFVSTFSKYTAATADAPSPVDGEAEKRARAKTATKIYKKACTDSGKSFCFFKNFATWSEFVQGRLEDGEFYEKALQEVKKMAEEESGQR